MKKVSVITRAAIVTGLLAAVAVPAANASSDNANLGNSADVHQDGGASANANGVGRPDYWGGCRGVHGGANPGEGLGNGLTGGFHTGMGNGAANGWDKDWKDCSPAPEDVAGTSVDLPATR